MAIEFQTTVVDFIKMVELFNIPPDLKMRVIIDDKFIKNKEASREYKSQKAKENEPED